jgi:hypothetical protein
MEQYQKNISNPEKPPNPVIFNHNKRDSRLEEWEFNVMACGPLE